MNKYTLFQKELKVILRIIFYRWISLQLGNNALQQIFALELYS